MIECALCYDTSNAEMKYPRLLDVTPASQFTNNGLWINAKTTVQIFGQLPTFIFNEEATNLYRLAMDPN